MSLFCCCCRFITVKLNTNNVSNDHVHASKLCHKIFKKKEDVLIEKYNNKTHISIEGTDSFKNWIDNLSLMRRSDDIHRGFRRYALEVMKKYSLNNVLNKNDDIILSGYSSGAACAIVLLYEYLKTAKEPINKNIELILFGSPKPGGKIFKDKFNEILNLHNIQISSYKNGNDIVCHLPPKCMGYYNVTDIIQLDSKYKSCIKNHKISEYVNNLDNIL